MGVEGDNPPCPTQFIPGDFMQLNKTSPFILHDLYFYDIKSCYYQLSQTINFEMSEEVDINNKQERNIALGKEQIDNPDLQKFFQETTEGIVDPEGRLCKCGRRGCLEAYASAPGMVWTIREMLKNDNTPSVLRNINIEDLTSKDIFLAAQKGDKIALEAFDYTGKILGMKLSDAIAFSSPEAIILFGGVAKAGDFIFTPTKKYMEQYLLPIYRNKVKLLPSLLKKENAAVLGAAALVWTH